MSTPGGGLACIAYAPCEAQAIVAGGARAVLTEKTDYPFDGATPALYLTCRVDPVTPQTPFHIPKDQLCDDEVGVDVQGTCTLLADLRTVHVKGVERFYESVSGSCGDDDEEDSRSFSADIPAGDEEFPSRAPTNIPMSGMQNGGTCFYTFAALDCSDHADWVFFNATNQLNERS